MSHLISKIFPKIFLLIFFVLFVGSGLEINAQEGGASNSSGSGDNLIENSMQDLSVVAGTGIGGAILGLSTLSFVKSPKAHMRNILVGGSIGIIIGVAIIAYSQATKSHERIFKSNSSGDNSRQSYQWNNQEERVQGEIIKEQIALEERKNLEKFSTSFQVQVLSF